jgi:quercetin dioxygenase-like cupin family protein
MSELTVNDLVVNHHTGEQTASDMRIMFRAAKLGGHFSVMAGEIRSRELLAPHQHTKEDQLVFLLSGELQFEVGGKDGLHFSAKAGDYVLKPRGIMHGFWNEGDQTVQYIELSTENGFERFVDARSEGMTHMVNLASSELGMSFDIDRIPELMAEHRLTGLAGANLPGIRELLASDDFCAAMQAMKDPENRKLGLKMAIAQVLARRPA